MLARRSLLLSLAAVALCVVGAAAIFSAASSPGQAGRPPEALPDLVQREPRELGVARKEGRFALGFASAVENHGDGRLIVRGSRAADEPDMTAEQLVDRVDGSQSRVPGIGRIRYTRSKSHDHWHYLAFDRYELRRASDGRLARPDRKTGFCLGDRYDPGVPVPGKPPEEVLTGECLKNRPQALKVTEGISVGYGDDYPAYLEGQSIDITGLPAGRYELVHRVNADRRLRELTHANNASSVLLGIDWPRGSGREPELTILRNCRGRPRCAR